MLFIDEGYMILLFICLYVICYRGGSNSFCKYGNYYKYLNIGCWLVNFVFLLFMELKVLIDDVYVI